MPLPALRAKDRTIDIRARDLRFSTAEAFAFLRNVLNTPIYETSAAQLLEKTGGWISGLRLLSLSLEQDRNVAQLLKKLPETSHVITNYLLTEVLAQQPAAIRDVLLQTAILDRFSAPLCEAVSQKQGKTASGMSGREFITWLEQWNLFVVPLDDRQEWFRYHHMFQKFLQHRLREQRSPSEIASLHMQASRWFVRHGPIEEALSHALAAADTLAAAELIDQHRHIPLNEDKWYVLEKWLALSQQAMQQPGKADDTLERMKASTQESQNPSALIIARSTRARVALLRGDTESALR